MNFELNDEQRMLKESVSRFLADRYTFENRLEFIKAEKGYDPDIWKNYADLGLLLLPFSEEDGGLGGGPVEIMIVAEAFGRALTIEPYVSTCVIAASLLRNCASAEQRAELVPQIGEGATTLAFAHTEPDEWHEPGRVKTSARRDGGGWWLNGAKSLVLHGGSADKLIVSAIVDGSAETGLFLVEADAPGLSKRDYETQDGMRAAEIELSDVRVGAKLRIGSGDAGAAIEAATDEAAAATCAEAVGVMEASLDLTVEYLKTRSQFGTNIGKFQSLQHQAADMVVALEQARSMAMYATMMSREENPAERQRAISAAKIQVGQSARLVGQRAVQLHGGVGMTMELAIGHYFKRLTMLERAYGDTDFHFERLGEAGGIAA